MNREDFAASLAGIFEHSPWIAAMTADQRPFTSRQALLVALCQTVVAANDDEKLALIRAHPDLVGNATLTPESKNEQAAAGLGKLSSEEVAHFNNYNAKYRERFGFPFVICARINKKEAILKAFPTRLQNSRGQEIKAALAEIFKIAELRLEDLIE